MTPEEGFESAQYLVSWANQQLSELEEVIKTFSESNPGTVVKEFNRKTNRDDIKIKFKPLNPRIRGVANNIIKDLRDALDQAANAASFLVSGKHRRRAHFPFAQSPDDFDTAVTRNQCKDIPERLYPILKSYEPYPTGDEWDGGNNFLRLLGTISGPHKHRFTLATAMQPDSQEISDFELSTGKEGGTIFPDTTVAVNNEITFLSLSSGGYFKGKITASGYIAFADTKLKGIPVDLFLKSVAASVGNIVQDLQAKALTISQEC